MIPQLRAVDRRGVYGGSVAAERERARGATKRAEKQAPSGASQAGVKIGHEAAGRRHICG